MIILYYLFFWKYFPEIILPSEVGLARRVTIDVDPGMFFNTSGLYPLPNGKMYIFYLNHLRVREWDNSFRIDDYNVWFIQHIVHSIQIHSSVHL